MKLRLIWGLARDQMTRSIRIAIVPNNSREEYWHIEVSSEGDDDKQVFTLRDLNLSGPFVPYLFNEIRDSNGVKREIVWRQLVSFLRKLRDWLEWEFEQTYAFTCINIDREVGYLIIKAFPAAKQAFRICDEGGWNQDMCRSLGWSELFCKMNGFKGREKEMFYVTKLCWKLWTPRLDQGEEDYSPIKQNPKAYLDWFLNEAPAINRSLRGQD